MPLVTRRPPPWAGLFEVNDHDFGLIAAAMRAELQGLGPWNR
ncbi:hypothetical protein QTI33_17630 [Variovorax sp. J22P271]|nr:hypothetical protein [Variovorax sp. J22P271]MDM0033959.1 hypothetical protein [Variovorax sp. J22P271]